MSDENPRPAIRIWNAIVLVVRCLLRAIEAALLFGPWGFGVGLLLGLLVGGLMALGGQGVAVIFGPLVGAGIGAVLGAAFGLVAGTFFPALVEQAAQHPMFNAMQGWRLGLPQAKPPTNSTLPDNAEESLATISQQAQPTSSQSESS